MRGAWAQTVSQDPASALGAQLAQMELEGGGARVRPQKDRKGYLFMSLVLESDYGAGTGGQDWVRQESRCDPLLQDVAFSKGLPGQRPETSQEVPLEGDQTINPHSPLNKSPSEHRHGGKSIYIL